MPKVSEGLLVLAHVTHVLDWIGESSPHPKCAQLIYDSNGESNKLSGVMVVEGRRDGSQVAWWHI